MKTFQRVRGHGTFKEINFKILTVHMFSFLKLIILRKYANPHFLPQITTDVPQPTSKETPPPQPQLLPHPEGESLHFPKFPPSPFPEEMCANKKPSVFEIRLADVMDLWCSDQFLMVLQYGRKPSAFGTSLSSGVRTYTAVQQRMNEHRTNRHRTHCLPVRVSGEREWKYNFKGKREKYRRGWAFF